MLQCLECIVCYRSVSFVGHTPNFVETDGMRRMSDSYIFFFLRVECLIATYPSLLKCGSLRFHKEDRFEML